MNMKKLLAVYIVAIAVLLFVLPGCSKVGEDPFPAPGPLFESDRSVRRVVLFKNGSVYKFDYTAKYDGIALSEFRSPTRASDGEIIPGGPWSSMSTNVEKNGGASPKLRVVDGRNEGGVYTTKGINVFEFNHHKKYNYTETWMFTLFDDPNLVGKGWNSISLWAKFVGPLETEGTLAPTINVYATSSSGFSYGTGTVSIPTDWQYDGQWHRYTINLETNDKVIPDTDRVKEWGVGASENAGHIYVDEIIISK